MARLEKEVLIEAPLEDIFSYLNYPSNLLQVWPSLMEITDLQALPNGGYRFKWVYKMAGMRFKGEAEYTKIVPDQFFVIETKGAITSVLAWTVRRKDDLTRVTFMVEYKVPIPLLGHLAEAIIVKINDHEADLIMANLRTRLMAAKPETVYPKLTSSIFRNL